MNKFHGDDLVLADFADFVTAQIENLRSSNSRNALNLVYEIYSHNHVTGDQLYTFSWVVFNAVL
jgi:hypothetical protein